MKCIRILCDDIADELVSAEEYAERYVNYTSLGLTNMAEEYRQMASDELSHAEKLHDFAVDKVAKLSSQFPMPKEMEKQWGISQSVFEKKREEILNVIA